MRESRRVLVSLAALLVGLVVVNVIATMFYRSTGGFGYLDLNGGANLLDSRPAYTPAGAHALLAGYGAAGRTRHAVLILATDIAFPAVLALFGALATRHSTRLAGVPEAARRWLILLPLAYLASDYAENGLELALLRGFPHEPARLATAASAVTTGKTALATGMLLVIVVAYVVALLRRRAARRQQPPLPTRLAERDPDQASSVRNGVASRVGRRDRDG
jgi:hypothetical protein